MRFKNIRWHSLAAALVTTMLLACTSPPQKVEFRLQPDGTWVVSAEWEAILITVTGLEEALAKAMEKLQQAQQSGNTAHQQAWQDIINRTLDLKGESIPDAEPKPAPNPVPVPDEGWQVAELPAPQAATITRRSLSEAMSAYLAYQNGFTSDVAAALAVGVSPSDLQEVKTALLY